MAFPTAPNGQVTDPVTQAQVRVLGDQPAVGLGNLFVATAQALANAARNATPAQRANATTLQAATVMGVTRYVTIDTSGDGVASEDILNVARPGARTR